MDRSTKRRKPLACWLLSDADENRALDDLFQTTEQRAKILVRLVLVNYLQGAWSRTTIRQHVMGAAMATKSCVYTHEIRWCTWSDSCYIATVVTLRSSDYLRSATYTFIYMCAKKYWHCLYIQLYVVTVSTTKHAWHLLFQLFIYAKITSHTELAHSLLTRKTTRVWLPWP